MDNEDEHKDDKVWTDHCSQVDGKQHGNFVDYPGVLIRISNFRSVLVGVVGDVPF